MRLNWTKTLIHVDFKSLADISGLDLLELGQEIFSAL